MIVPESKYHEYHDLLEKVHSQIMSIKIDMNDATLRKKWGRAIAAYDCLDDAIDAILEFDTLEDNAYKTRRPILYYYGILQAFSIQIDALKQLYQFFYGNKNVKLEKNKINIAEIRNDIVHSCSNKGKESCFIAKCNNMPIDSLNYGVYKEDKSFAEKKIDLRDICYTQVQSICDILNRLSAIPNDQIYFYRELLSKKS